VGELDVAASDPSPLNPPRAREGRGSAISATASSFELRRRAARSGAQGPRPHGKERGGLALGERGCRRSVELSR
jgi:hypothetical protein